MLFFYHDLRRLLTVWTFDRFITDQFSPVDEEALRAAEGVRRPVSPPPASRLVRFGRRVRRRFRVLFFGRPRYISRPIAPPKVMPVGREMYEDPRPAPPPPGWI